MQTAAEPHISKGLLREARELASSNITLLSVIVTDESPLIGIEPSAILGFRDEYPDLVPASLVPAAQRLAKQTFMIDEFLASEAALGKFGADAFTANEQKIKLHGHCHQKALASLDPTVAILSLPLHYSVEVIPSGCCGMAGSFGYEREHFSAVDADRRFGALSCRSPPTPTRSLPPLAQAVGTRFSMARAARPCTL